MGNAQFKITYIFHFVTNKSFIIPKKYKLISDCSIAEANQISYYAGAVEQTHFSEMICARPLSEKSLLLA